MLSSSMKQTDALHGEPLYNFQLNQLPQQGAANPDLVPAASITSILTPPSKCLCFYNRKVQVGNFKADFELTFCLKERKLFWKQGVQSLTNCPKPHKGQSVARKIAVIFDAMI